ncbi:MAG: hypothetical protein Q4G28_11940, partial [Neisseria sp.]|nr:hypothetical protein [Neisseria sp.]
RQAKLRFALGTRLRGCDGYFFAKVSGCVLSPCQLTFINGHYSADWSANLKSVGVMRKTKRETIYALLLICIIHQHISRYIFQTAL